MNAIARLLPCLLLTLAVPAPARAETAGTLAIVRWSVDGGGAGFGQAGAFILGGTIGQPDAARVERLSWVLYGGFWSPGAAVPVAVDEGPQPIADRLPAEARIYPIVPNPSARGTRVSFDLPAARHVEVRVFDVRGALVRTLASGEWPAGRHALDWDGVGAGGTRAAPGLYFVRVHLGALQRSQKLIKLR